MKNLTKIIFWIFISTMIMYGLMIVLQPSQIKIEMDELLNDMDSTIVIDTTIIDSPIILEDSTILTVCATMYHPVVGQCDDSPDVTADQTKIPNIDSCSHLNWIAVSQDLFCLMMDLSGTVIQFTLKRVTRQVTMLYEMR